MVVGGKSHYVLDPTSGQHIFKLGREAFPFPQDLRQTLSKSGQDFYLGASRDRNRGTGLLWLSNDGL